MSAFMTVAIVALSVVPFSLLAIVAAALLRRPCIMTEPARPALILAAHQDDCAILAGGYAVFAKASGCRVQVAYLTCGASSPDQARAVTRRAESLAAWRALDVGEDDVFFFGLSEHAVSAPSTWTDAERERARAWLGGLLRQLPPNGVVFLPAAGESHVDHRGLRRLALEAWNEVGRRDLLFLEGPEYNDYVSLLQSPAKTLAAIASRLPLLARLRPARPAWTGFAEGGVYWTLPPDEQRMNRRRELLRAFVSEDGALLVHLFGWFERYRPITDPVAGLAKEPPRGYVALGGLHRGASAILALAALAEGAAALGWALSCAALHRGAWGWAVVAALALGGAALGARKRAKLEGRLLYWSLGVGALGFVTTMFR